MKNTLKLELKKALCNKLFIISLIIMILPCLMSFLYNVEAYNLDLKTSQEMTELTGNQYNPLIGANTIYDNWVGGESMTLGSSIFFYIFPLLIAVPYGWSYCKEVKTGYVKNICLRSSRTSYYLSKYIAVFISGGLIMIIPMILSIMLISSFIPAYTPQILYDIYHGIFKNDLMSQLYYTKPLLYIINYLFINFIFCGLLTCLSYSITNIIKNHIATMIFPFLSIITFHYVSSSFAVMMERDISPIIFLHPNTLGYYTTWAIIIIEAIVLFLLTFIPTVVMGRKREIYS